MVWQATAAGRGQGTLPFPSLPFPALPFHTHSHPHTRALHRPAAQVAQCRTPAEGARLLVAAAYKAWLQHETRTDDISVVVVFFEDFDPGFGEDLPAKLLAAPSQSACARCAAAA